MKRLKFLIMAVVAFATQSVMAVTLPSTSYTEHTTTETVTVSSGVGGAQLPSSSFLQLGTIDYSECTQQSTFQNCEQCCSQLVSQCYSDATVTDKSECNTLSSNCNDSCGYSLPLDGGLSFLLILSAIGAAVRPLMSRKIS